MPIRAWRNSLRLTKQPVFMPRLKPTALDREKAGSALSDGSPFTLCRAVGWKDRICSLAAPSACRYRSCLDNSMVSCDCHWLSTIGSITYSWVNLLEEAVPLSSPSLSDRTEGWSTRVLQRAFIGDGNQFRRQSEADTRTRLRAFPDLNPTNPIFPRH